MASFGNKDKIWIKKEEHKVTFDIKIPMPKGAVFAMYLKHLNLEETVNMAAEIKKITIQQAHEQLGHIGTAAILDGLMIVEVNGQLASHFEHFAGKNPKCAGY